MATTSGSATKSKKAADPMTAQKVIEMFASLNLPVCDDGTAIEGASKKNKGQHLRSLKQVDPAQRAKANEFFDNVERLTNRRKEHLDIVYTAYQAANDQTIASFLASGTQTVTAGMLDGFRKNAVLSFKTDDALADHFVKRYLKDHDIGPVPDPVANFHAASGLGEIELTWKNPPQNFKEVEIERLDVETGQGITVFQGAETRYSDRTAQVGKRYVYRAYSWNKSVKSKTFVEAKPNAVCMAEVSQQRAEWKNGRVRITWKLPSDNASVLIFRRNGGMPVVRRGGGEPIAESASTIPVFKGAGNSWEDTRAEEGYTYHYLIVAQFGPSLFTQGAAIVVAIPKTPSAPAWFEAHYRMHGEQHVVELKGPDSQEKTAVTYVLVRRQGSTPAANPTDGHAIETAQLRNLDKNVVPGQRYTYTLFTKSGDLYSKTGTSAPSVDILPDVTDLRATPGDGTVNLEWKLPAATDGVIIRGGPRSPQNPNDGREIPTTGKESAKDENLPNNHRYHYLVCCKYRPDGRETVFSKGVRIDAIPVRLPDPVPELKATVEQSMVTCIWPRRNYGGIVLVLRSEKPHGRTIGERFNSGKLAALIKEIGGEKVTTSRDPQTGDNKAIDAAPAVHKPYYSTFTVAGNHSVVVGASGHCVTSLDVDNLSLTAARDGVILTWDWPPDCRAVTVTRKVGEWPLGPADPQATSVKVGKAAYMDGGGKYKQTLKSGSGHFFYIVYAQAAASSGTVHAPGRQDGCRKEIPWRPWMTLKYRLPKGNTHHRPGKKMHLTWEIANPNPEFAGFILLADESGIPAGADDGIALFRWLPDTENLTGLHESWVSLNPIQEAKWPHFYCKAVLLNPEQEDNTLVIHPDVCEAIFLDKDTHVPRNIKNSDFLRTPETALCPFCFESFPIERTLFKPDTGGEPVPGNRTWWGRARNRPVSPPRNKNNRAMTQKVCPECKQDLHASAGVQKSLVIGMVGAKYSGKSHYVASLVHQLEGSGSRDMYASLLALGEQTLTRYKTEFKDRLFGNRRQLHATVDVPPPLVYDLTFDPRLWKEKVGRSVTLALYDTAGEHFDNQEEVRRMVRYLRVASGIMFLVDPLQSRGVRNFLPKNICLPDQDPKADPTSIIARVVQELVKDNVIGEKQPLEKPVAMVMTKCDVLRQAGLIPDNRLWTMDERHKGRFRGDIHDDMSGMMGEYLQKWNPAAYQAVCKRFSRHAFFGVSATGCAPDNRRFPFISPWRVEDPLFWLLSELGVIPVEEN